MLPHPKNYIEFQGRNSPLAYLITIRCYGTWLHGDERGSVDRRGHNRYGTPNIPTNENLRHSDKAQLKNPPIVLDGKQRLVVEKAINEVCVNRGHHLYALQARTNHVHTVISAIDRPEPVMNAFKAYSTRQLRNKKLISADMKIWSRHGSTRYLWTERHLELAIDYVINCQGEELPKFD